MSTGTDFGIAKELDIERYRQIAEEGWTAEHDDAHTGGELASAAACYCSPIMIYALWPWAKEWWKPKDRRRDLVRAGALIIAEIERLDRQAAVPPTPGRLMEGGREQSSKVRSSK